jgi:hypothetical protein
LLFLSPTLTFAQHVEYMFFMQSVESSVKMPASHIRQHALNASKGKVSPSKTLKTFLQLRACRSILVRSQKKAYYRLTMMMGRMKHNSAICATRERLLLQLQQLL